MDHRGYGLFLFVRNSRNHAFLPIWAHQSNAVAFTRKISLLNCHPKKTIDVEIYIKGNLNGFPCGNVVSFREI